MHFSSSHHQTGPVQEPRDKPWTSVCAVGGVPPPGGLWELSMSQGELIGLASSHLCWQAQLTADCAHPSLLHPRVRLVHTRTSIWVRVPPAIRGQGCKADITVKNSLEKMLEWFGMFLTYNRCL